MSENIQLPKSAMRSIMRGVVRGVLKPVLGTALPVPVQRRIVGAITATNRPPRGVNVAKVKMHEVDALKVTSKTTTPGNNTALLYLHGGAYVLGAPSGYRNVAGHVALATGTQVYPIDYRMAPENPYPAAVEDAVSAYQWLLAQGFAPDKIAIGGDSAGGGLSLATSLALRERNLPLPAALLLISPWVDLTLSGETMQSKANADAMLRKNWITRSAKQYMADTPMDHPGGSPLFADLTGLPPLFIQTGSEEVLLDDSLRLAARAQAAGVQVKHQVYYDMWHVFQIHAGILPESGLALDTLCEQLKQVWNLN